MLFDFLKSHVGVNAAPFVAVGLFVAVVGVSLWLTPYIARWIDERRKTTPGFYDDMMEKPDDAGEAEE